MKIEAKLVGPMTLQLRRPLTSPVHESEFYVIGCTTHRKERMLIFKYGIVAGFGICSIIFLILEKFFGK